MKNCPECGLELPDGAIICTRCSHRFLPNTNGDSEMNDTGWSVITPGKKGRLPKKVLLSMCAVVIVAGGALVLLGGMAQGGNGKKTKTIQQAAQLLQEENYSACVDYAQQALKEYPSDQSLIQMLGDAQVGLGNYDEAAQTYDQVGVANLDTGTLPRYIEAQIYGGSQEKVAQAFDRYMEENSEYEAPVLAQVAATSAQEEDSETMERSISELNLMMENGVTDPDWNLETAAQILERSMETPAQATLSVALPYYLGAVSQTEPDQAVEQTLADCYAVWRSTTADPLQSDWECYSLMNGASRTAPMQSTVYDAYISFLNQLSADLGGITETLLNRKDSGTLDFGAQADPDCEQTFTEAILNTYAAQNGSVDRLSQMEQQMERKNYRQVIQLWENDPWMQKHDLWYQDGTFRLAPLAGSGNYVHLSSSGVYMGQIEDGVAAGAGSMVMRGSDGHILYYVGVWVDGVMDGTWIDLDEKTGETQIVQTPSKQSSTSSTASKSSSSSEGGQTTTQQTPQASAPQTSASQQTSPQTAASMPSMAELQEMMRQAEEQSKQMMQEIE